ncbi:MAG TPA: replication-associated recombination protein A [Candidatus Hydrogenedentes bacterium]|jgi:putative ATPase|nr:MAG: Replication-associated recombination protein A [Candidatus Hydrogenedentes bacterium ADurb.Bin170]HNZ48407.1 replication-associated recombination protein A [Candidatus Hydrogenedentota bacterium]HOD94558.1 replication-associated recombination protein A [Candidatus Hydrogenedentota bacterium]HOH42534.1 replication-associated recombination protein A [Candidatus Hydrogenedentota bacterium]HOM48632.1 replication-associated recombination protein A [Candidatus Hydrogenedentota bacterium]
MNNSLFPEEKPVPSSLPKKEAPLARRVAPKSLDEILGQSHILGEGKLLRRAIEADRITSIILYGPPGCGKTALARVIAMRTKAVVEPLNAVLAGVTDIRRVVKSAQERFTTAQRATILFLDEIHRFSKTQQDALLPHVENGLFTLIGATTENPYFSIVSPLLSRSQIFEFKALSEEDIQVLLNRALTHRGRGFSGIEIQIEPEAAAYIAKFSEGDGRRAINALELAILTTKPVENTICITLPIAAESIQQKLLHYDGSGDSHYDAASAFIKSMRGSHPDAALFWMARMIEAGETPRFIARRICIAAAEEVGCADPMALVLANAAFQAAEFVGFPEARIILAEAAVYVASAPKSNASYLAIDAALGMVREGKSIAVPDHLKDSSYQGAKKLSRGIGYRYAHDFEDAYVAQDYGVPRSIFYKPTERGQEELIKKRLDTLEEIDRNAAESVQPSEEPQ